MALLKQFDLDNGFVAEYWKVAEVFFNPVSKSLSCILSLYKDVESRKKGSLPVLSRALSFEIELKELDSCNPVKRCYEKISEPLPDEKGQETNWFIDAKDV